MLVFILPDNEEDTLARPSMPDVYIDYFDVEFSIISALGRGEFSEAFSTKSRSDERVYAVKRTKHPFIGTRDRARQLEEVKILWHLGRHQHCIQLFDAWEDRKSVV